MGERVIVTEVMEEMVERVEASEPAETKEEEMIEVKMTELLIFRIRPKTTRVTTIKAQKTV